MMYIIATLIGLVSVPPEMPVKLVEITALLIPVVAEVLAVKQFVEDPV